VGGKQTIKATAQQATARLKDMAGDTASRAREEAERVAADRKNYTAERLNSYSSAIHESARSLEEKDPNLAYFTHRAADRLQGAADYVRNRSFSDLRHDAEDVARRHPAIFFGGLFAAGLLVGNLLKASRRHSGDSSEFAAGEDDRMTTTSAMIPEPAPGSGL
jgi:hypothetical protein